LAKAGAAATRATAATRRGRERRLRFMSFVPSRACFQALDHVDTSFLARVNRRGIFFAFDLGKDGLKRIGAMITFVPDRKRRR